MHHCVLGRRESTDTAAQDKCPFYNIGKLPSEASIGIKARIEDRELHPYCLGAGQQFRENDLQLIKAHSARIG
ncbi:MAG: hypothetical protein ABT18_06655 [Rhodanobacter sp. SCN 66-43]|nr:MAG: hypothetical protein ABT18_06655 [Rhodanobacter sp. SCN 66-43]